MLSEQVAQILTHFKALMLKSAVPLQEMVVFGSQARGDAGPDSDIDVLVVLDHVKRVDNKLRDAIYHCAWEAEFDSGDLIQPIIMTRDQLENSAERSSLLVAAIHEHGIRV